MMVSKVVPGVWRCGGRWVNWYIVDGGATGLTVIDAGLPGYHRHLDGALSRIGRTRADVRAVVLTHGHIDHIGMSSVLAEAGARVHLHPADESLAADPSSNKSERSLIPYLRYPATLAFVGHCIVQGATRPPKMPASTPMSDGQTLEVPGNPVVTHTPGHTDGSCVLDFREHDVAFVGDLLCTASPITGSRVDPQIQTRGSNRDSDQTIASLDRLDRVTSSLVLPGHGEPWRDGVEAAAASARRFGCT